MKLVILPALRKRISTILLNKKQEVNDESVKDTLLDLANYCIMCSMKISEDLENKKEIRYYQNGEELK